jgi:adenylosuccinate synthase
MCDVPGEIMARLNRGQSGVLEIAQGFQLSYLLPDMFPYTTSRNCTTAAGLDDMMLPVHYAGNVVINLRTYPIRINSNKYLDGSRHLTWDEVQKYEKEGKPFEIKKYDSGPGYPDQDEVSWTDVTNLSGSPTPIMEITSVTKLPRRVFTFSKQNMRQAIEYNRANGWVFLSINFVNYIDHAMTGRRGTAHLGNANDDIITQKVQDWLKDNVLDIYKKTDSMSMICILGTGPKSADKVHVVI